jgi:hypothetical protein
MVADKKEQIWQTEGELNLSTQISVAWIFVYRQNFLLHERSHSTIRSTQTSGLASNVRKWISGVSGAS